jgi:thymidylate kinase
LTSPLAVAIERNKERIKPGKESDDFVMRRHKQFFLPHFPNSQTVELDTNQTRAATIRALRRLVWATLGASPGLPALNGTRRHGLRSRAARNIPVVEFIGVTGVGKSTLIAAAAELLSRQGFRVRDADEVILARYGLAFPRHPKLRSALVHVLAVPPFLEYLCTREGRRLSRLAVGSIARGMAGIWTGVGLLRNFSKRIGCHLLLDKARGALRDSDVVLCDEGVVHAAHNLFVHTGSEPNREAIVLFGQLVPKPDLLIWVTAPTSQSAEVILWRGHSRVEGTNEAAWAFAEHAHATFEVLSSVEGLRERIHQVDNTANADDSRAALIHARASALCAFLKQHLPACPGPTVSAPGTYAGVNGHGLNGNGVQPTQPTPASKRAPELAYRDEVGLESLAILGVQSP